MNAKDVRIVVGEGRSSQQGLLRFVLDGEGYDVVADAASPAALARILAVHKPDVVVLDDGIGATAVGMVREMVPKTKIVLVWPGAVVPIGGAAQVPPSRVLQDLGPAIARVTGVAGVTAAMTGAAMVDRAKRDPAGLRRMAHDADDGAAAATGAAAAAAIVTLPVSEAIGDNVVTVPEAEPAVAGAAGAGAAVGAAGSSAAAGSPLASGAPVRAQSVLNRRLGNLALGGAAVAGAIVVALALGGAKVPIAQVSGQAYTFTPPAAPGPGDGSGGTDGSDGIGFPGQPTGGLGGPGGGQSGHQEYGGTLDFYPIQPYLSSVLPTTASYHQGSGAPLPKVETAGRRGGRNHHHGQTAKHQRNDRTNR